MVNQNLVKILNEFAMLYEVEGVAFKPQAYEHASYSISSLEKDVSEIYKDGGFESLIKIPAVGKGIAEKIEEYIKTGKIKEYEKMKSKFPVDLWALTAIEGVGPKTIKILYKELGVRTIEDLQRAAKAHKIYKLPRFGKKIEQNILRGIEFVKSGGGRFLLGTILPVSRKLENRLKDLSYVSQAVSAGSVRRRKETVGDIDILVVCPERSRKTVMNFFCSMPEILKVLVKGETKSSVRLDMGLDADIRVVSEESFGAALQYFTGSKEHNIKLREVAAKKGCKLNEYGLYEGKKYLAGKTEEEIYKKLGLQWVPAEMREDRGEIELALKNKLPELLEQKDIEGDLHCHCNWAGGENSIKEMAVSARGMGYGYIGVSDHTKFLRIENGLDEKKIGERNKEIDKLNGKLEDFKIFKGAEANIMNDGSIDVEDQTLAELDYVIAGVHSTFKMEKEEMTERIIRAMKNPNVDIISHPTGRLINQREEYKIDMEKILRAARETGTVLEINSSPLRLDLNDLNIFRAKEAGVKMIINTDSHYKDQMGLMEYGVAQARRGWAEKDDIINTMSSLKLLEFFRLPKNKRF